MRSKLGLFCVAAALVLAASPVSGWAQHVGFQVGIAQGNFGFPPTQTPAVAVRSTFIGNPIMIVPGLPLSPPVPFIPSVPLVPNFPTVIVPNQVLVPGQTFLPPVFPTPFVNVNGAPPAFVPQNPFQPGLSIGPGTRQGPPIGMPRGDVLRQFGQPSVTVITSTGETLYFTGGVTVIIQNGQVVGPR